MIQALRLAVATLFLGLVASKTTIIKEWLPHEEACLEELNLNYYYGGLEALDYNQTCLHKCSYEKSEKIDCEGNPDFTNFPDEERDAAKECWDLIDIDDPCKKITLVANCIDRKTNNYMQDNECEDLYSFTDDNNSCYTRCYMIQYESLLEDGKVNFNIFDDYDKDLRDYAEKSCDELVKDDGDKCGYDLNQYYCISHIMWRDSMDLIETEVKCSKENDDYPFYGGYVGNKFNHCYDRCVLVENGELDPNNIKESNHFINSGMDAEKIKRAYDICKSTKRPEDLCLRDLYDFDCITHVYYSTEDYLKNEIECSLETDTPLINPRGVYTVDYCKIRCTMIKEGQLDENGNLNATYYNHQTHDGEIIENSIEYCKTQLKTYDCCARDVFQQYCTISKIYDEIHKECNADNFENGGDDQEKYNCVSRCYMIHSNELGLEGEILIEKFVGKNNKTEVDVKNIIEKCDVEVEDQKSCTKDMERFYCVTREIWGPEHEEPVIIKDLL